MAVDQKRLFLIMLTYVSLITLTWWAWLRYKLPQLFAYIVYLLITLSCLYFAAFKAQGVAGSNAMTRKTRWRFTKILTVTVWLILIVFPTLDLIYIHIWFIPENAIFIPLSWIPISAGGVAILEWIRRAERRERAHHASTK